MAQDSERPEMAVSLLVMENDELIASVLANRYRADLDKAGIGDGRHAFTIRIPAGLSSMSRHVIRVSSEEDGVDLRNSPTVLEPATARHRTCHGNACLIGPVAARSPPSSHSLRNPSRSSPLRRQS